jgi:hypothetical protein
MIEIMLPPPSDSILYYLYHSTPDNAVYDIIFCILAVTILLLIDIGLRFVIELVEYNKAVGKECNTWNMLTALFFGWGSVTLQNGKKKRFLVSKAFRKSLFSKVSFEYPIFFTLAATAWSLPDVPVMGLRIDALLSMLFMLAPMSCEVVSIIEKLNELDAEAFEWFKKLRKFIKETKEVTKS